MGKIWVISDTHFFHNTMIKQGWRPFKSVSEMNESLINNWNKVVSKEDVVYHLGDVVLNRKLDFDKDILPNLNGKIIFIKGNHDSLSISHINRMFIQFRGKKIQLIHNPCEAILSDCDLVIHGHIHNSGKREFTNISKIPFYNVCCEYHNYKPKLLNEIIGEISDKRYKQK